MMNNENTWVLTYNIFVKNLLLIFPLQSIFSYFLFSSRKDASFEFINFIKLHGDGGWVLPREVTRSCDGDIHSYLYFTHIYSNPIL